MSYIRIKLLLYGLQGLVFVQFQKFVNVATRIAGCCASSTEYSNHIGKKLLTKFFQIDSFFLRDDRI